MKVLAIPAIFDGTAIRLLAEVPSTEPYRVVVTFVEPVPSPTESDPDRSRFWASFGAWQDDGSVDDTIETIHADRRSKPEPPQ
jgi:hypothetical protein